MRKECIRLEAEATEQQESATDIFNSHTAALEESSSYARPPSNDEIIDMFAGFIDSLNLQQKFQEYLDNEYPLPPEAEEDPDHTTEEENE